MIKKFFQQQSMLTALLALCVLIMALALFSLMREKRENEKLRKSPERQALVQSSRDQELQKFNLTGFDEQGKKFWNLEGETAKIDPGQTVFLEENVTLKMRDGTAVKTDHVKWDPKEGLLTTEARVHVVHRAAIIEGTGASGRPADSYVQLNRDIHMQINATTDLTCKGPMKIFYKDNKMIFYRNVTVVDDKGILKSNRMDVFFDSAEKKITKIIAMGNVQIDRGGDTSKSQKAIYDVASGSIKLVGNPEISFHKNSTKALDVPFGS